MRDKMKQEQYFPNFIAYENSRIEKYTALRKKAVEQRGETDKGVKAANMNLFNFSLHKLIASYSIGMPMPQIKNQFPNMCDWFLLTDNVSYADLVTVASLCILLDFDEYIVKLRGKALEAKLVDSFIKFLLQDETMALSSKSFDPYSKIAVISQVPDKENALKEYLHSWYLDNKDAYWFNSHKKDSDVYFGYWSFESAAVVKILGLSPSNFYYSDYFPKDFF